MLAVFLQVLVVAVLGLGAITRNRQEARRAAEDQAIQDAEDALSSIVANARDEVLQALEDVRLHPDFGGLERIRSGVAGHGAHLDVVNIVYQLDPDTGEVFWTDGIHRLHVPPERRAALLEQALVPEVDATAKDMYEAYQQAPSDTDRITNGLAFCRRFPWRQTREENFPQALYCVHRLIGIARERAELPRDERDVEAAFANLEQVLLTALEVAALNEDRREDIPRSDWPKLDGIPSEVEAVIAGPLPGRGGLRRHVGAFREAQRLLTEGSFFNALGVALDEVMKAESDDVIDVGGRLFGLVPNVRVPQLGTSRHIVALLSPAAVKHLVEEMAEAVRLDRLGLSLQLVPTEKAADEGEGADVEIAASLDLSQVAGLRLPLRAELTRVRTAALPEEGPGELFYWGIIALSAAGLGLGGWVLVRLYTREVRLAHLKADFVSNLSHELKTPLTSIAMFAEMLQGGQLTSDEDRNEGVGILAQEAERLRSIVHRMLDTAKREARGAEYVLEPGDLNEVVGRAAERFRRIVTEPGLNLLVELHAEPLPVSMDRAAVDDLVSNLVSNAWKYKRGAEASVEVRTALRGRKAEITVADDGLGIPRSERRRVFEMFYRADAYLTRAAGTGLGLSLVRTIVKAHKGSVRIETGLNGHGSLFRVRLPLSRVSAARAEPASAPDDSIALNPEAEATS
jgi:two-component system phosphate regulon sensor histidine kinase PhoR